MELLNPYPNEHTARIINPNEFEQDSFRRKNIATGIDIILGKLKGQESLVTQAYRFKVENFTAEQAKKWLKDHKIKYILFEPASKQENKMKIFNTNLPEFIDNDNVVNLINELNSFDETEITMPWTSFGGSVWAGNNLIYYLKTTDKKIDVIVNGLAASMGAALIPYFNKSTVAKQADIMIHSVYSSVNKLAKKTNQDLYDALKSKIDEVKFKEITTYELKDIMFREGDDRVDLWVTGEQAHKFGLFDELIDLTPEEREKTNVSINELKLTANLDYKLPERLLNNQQINTNENSKESMKIDELKASHPALYDEVLELGKQAGKTEALNAEQDRVKSWMVFNDVDPVAVKAGIDSGATMKEHERLTFMRKSQTLDMQKALEASSPENVMVDKETGKPLTEEQKEAKKLDAALEKQGIKDKEAK